MQQIGGSPDGVRAEQPILSLTGMRQLFPLVSEAVGRIVALDDPG